jgi:hypothetical protein
MVEKKEKLKLSTWEKIWPSLIIGWFIMYFLGMVIFQIKYPNADTNSREYQSFQWLWIQLYLGIFILIYMIKKDFFKH